MLDARVRECGIYLSCAHLDRDLLIAVSGCRHLLMPDFWSTTTLR